MALSKVDICNLALGHLGTNANVLDIDDPREANEKTFALHYDITRRFTLKMVKPNFALKRALLSLSTEESVFGFGNIYNIPADCLQVLGIGEIQDKVNNYTIEANKIFIDDTSEYDDGLPVRYIRDETDVSKFSPDFIDLFSWVLAKNVCFTITQSKDMMSYITQIIPTIMSSCSAMNAQENRPVRISNSKFKQARYSDYPVNFEDKR